jgi:hypothetical protein
MITTFFLISVLYLGKTQWFIGPLDIYNRISSEAVLVTTNNDVWIPFNKEHCIKVFDNTGQLKKTIGQAGQGPEDLFYPVLLWQKDQIVALLDIKGIVYYDLNGNFLNRFPRSYDSLVGIHIPELGTLLYPSFGDLKEVYRFSDMNDVKSDVLALPRVEDPPGKRVLRKPTSNLAVNTKTGIAYISHPTQKKLYIIDLNENKAPREMNLDFDFEPEPFSFSERERIFNEGKYFKVQKPLGFKAGPEKERVLPDEKRMFERLRIGPNDELILLINNKIEANRVIALNETGERIESVINTHERAYRIVDILNEQALVLAYPDETVAIMKIPLTEVDQFFEDHPYPYH